MIIYQLPPCSPLSGNKSLFQSEFRALGRTDTVTSQATAARALVLLILTHQDPPMYTCIATDERSRDMISKES